MSIRIEIDLVEGETFDRKLRAFFPSIFEQAGPIFTDENVEPADEPVPVPASTAAPDEPPAEKPKRGPGRPRKVVTDAEQSERVFTVRRYGGQIDTEHQDSRTAAEVLIGLMKSADDQQAFDELMKHNAEEVGTWPAERQEQVREAAESWSPKLPLQQPAPAAEVEAPGPHTDLTGEPLTVLRRTKASARDAVQAYVNAKGTDASAAVIAKFAELDGMKNISSLPDDDPRHGKIVDWIAPKLGLEVV